MKILLIGDVVGQPGRSCVARLLPDLRAELGVDAVIANGENTAGGLGATPPVLKELLRAGVDVITLGNHTWRKKELAPALNDLEAVLRPANYVPGVPGKGSMVLPLADGRTLGIVNLIGRVFMDPVACPFVTGQREVEALRAKTSVIVVDFHAEATSEKIALGWYLDGLCTAVIGTHTHVQTADERVLPKGTAYITDAGMTGPFDSIIGMEPERIINRFLTGMPTDFVVAKERPGLNGVLIEADDLSGQARSIRRIVRML